MSSATTSSQPRQAQQAEDFAAESERLLGPSEPAQAPEQEPGEESPAAGEIAARVIAQARRDEEGRAPEAQAPQEPPSEPEGEPQAAPAEPEQPAGTGEAPPAEKAEETPPPMTAEEAQQALLRELERIAALAESRPALTPAARPAPAQPAAAAAPAGSAQAVQPAPAPLAPPMPEALPFANEDMHIEAMQSADGLNKVMTQVFYAALETFYGTLPLQVQRIVQGEIARERAEREFHQANPDLASAPSYIRFLSREVESEHPDWTPAQVWSETARRARESLRRPARTAQAAPAAAGPAEPIKPIQAVRRSGMVRRGGRRPVEPGDTRTPFEQERDELLG